MFKHKQIWLILFWGYLCCGVGGRAGAQTVLAWNAVPATTVAATNPMGYNVHVGAKSGVYTQAFNAGTATQLALPLPAGSYYGVVKAYNAANVEGSGSNEVAFTVAGSSPTPSPTASITPPPVVPTPTPTPGTMATFGTTSIGTVTDNSNGSTLIAQKVTLGTGGNLQSISLYLSKASGNIAVGIYGNGGSVPSTLLGTTGTFALATGWNTKPITPQLVLTAGSYWLAFLCDNDTATMMKVLTGAVSYSTGQALSGGMPKTFPTNVQSQAQTYSLYGSVLVVATPTPTPTATPTAKPTPTATPTPHYTYNSWLVLLNNEIANNVSPTVLLQWINANPPKAD
jgi:hypothetical protein